MLCFVIIYYSGDNPYLRMISRTLSLRCDIDKPTYAETDRGVNWVNRSCPCFIILVVLLSVGYTWAPYLHILMIPEHYHHGHL